MHLNFPPPPTALPPMIASRAKPFSPWATAVYALLATGLLLYTMRPYWSGNRLEALASPVRTAIWVFTTNMLLHDGTKQIPSRFRAICSCVGLDARRLAEQSQKVLRETMAFQSKSDTNEASQVRAHLVVLLGETGSKSEAFKLLAGLDESESADFCRLAQTLYGGSNATGITSQLADSADKYLYSSWSAWRLQSRSYSAAGETSEAEWVANWVDHQALKKTTFVIIVWMLSFIVAIVGLGLLFWLVRPEIQSLFSRMPLQTFSLGEGLGILVRAELWGSLLLLLCSQNWLTWTANMARGLVLAAPLVFLLAHRHWRSGQGSLTGFIGLPATSRTWLVMLAAAVGIFGVDWIFAVGIGSAAEVLGREGHWTEGLDEALLFEPWPMRFVPLANGIIWSPIYEEIAFRGVLFPALRDRLGVFASALLSSAVFASIHFYSMPGFLSVMVFGFACALVCQYTRSLIPSIVAHIIVNFVILGTDVALFS